MWVMLDGTPIEDMVTTAARLSDEGFDVMPHFPARIIPDPATLENWINRYQTEAGVTQALLLAGGVAQPHGDFHSSMQLLETGLFDRAGFKRLHVAGHPEGNRDIDPDGSDTLVMEALRWKQAFSERTDAKMAIATQFWASWAVRTTAIDANFPGILDAVEVGGAWLAASSAIHPLLAQERIPRIVFTRITGVTDGATAIDEFFSVVEDFVVAVLADEVVVVQASRQRKTGPKDRKTHGHETASGGGKDGVRCHVRNFDVAKDTTGTTLDPAFTKTPWTTSNGSQPQHRISRKSAVCLKTRG